MLTCRYHDDYAPPRRGRKLCRAPAALILARAYNPDGTVATALSERENPIPMCVPHARAVARRFPGLGGRARFDRVTVAAMIATLLHIVTLAARAHAAWPEYPVTTVTAAAREAVVAELETGVPAEVLYAIAQHESDLVDNCVSYRDSTGRRVDTVIGAVARRWPRGAVAGYLQATFESAVEARAAIAVDGGMRTGARQLAEWVASPLTHGSIRLALAGYAGGVAGVRRARGGVTAPAVAFADLFLRRARALGYGLARSTAIARSS